MKHSVVITVDIEDWPQSTWSRDLPVTSRAVDNTLRLLELLETLGIKITAFVLGKFAESFPSAVREIVRAGHEVASHGYGHVEVFKQSRGAFLEDVQHSKKLLEDITGRSVIGYRAPDFSIRSDSLWAFGLLAECGFHYDSSVFPISHPRYGIPGWPAGPVRLDLGGDLEILEFPIATFRFLGRNWPVGGGGYHRLLPGTVVRWLAGLSLRHNPFVFYCHPYEFDPKEFSETPLDIPWRVRLHQGLGRGRFRSRFSRFAKRFGGGAVEDLLLTTEWPRAQLQGMAF